MSRSHLIFRDVRMDEWVDRYEKSHQNPILRLFHTFGIPMIAVSIPLFLIAPLVRGFWKIPLSLFTAGWICQVLGHIIEGKPPEQSNAQALEAPSLQLAAFPSSLPRVDILTSTLFGAFSLLLLTPFPFSYSNTCIISQQAPYP